MRFSAAALLALLFAASATAKTTPKPHTTAVAKATAKSSTKTSSFKTTAKATATSTCKKQSFTDKFTSFNSKIWTLDVGTKSMLSYSHSTGLNMTLSQANQNIVLRSKMKFKLPFSFTVVEEASQAPGIVSPAIFRGDDGSDEVDLELVGATPKSLQTVVWKLGKRLMYSLADAPSGFKPAQFNTYTLAVTTSSLTLELNGKLVRTMKRKSGAPWPTQGLPFAMGPWASNSPDWAGALDWKKNAHPVMRVKSLTVTGCTA